MLNRKKEKLEINYSFNIMGKINQILHLDNFILIKKEGRKEIKEIKIEGSGYVIKVYQLDIPCDQIGTIKKYRYSVISENGIELEVFETEENARIFISNRTKI